jgi:hypothetical protein
MKCPNDDPAAAMMELVAMIQKLVERPAGRYRCEDLISAAAAFAGEACMRRARDFDVDNHDYNPGSPIFSTTVNVLLSGDRSEWKDIPVTSAFGGLYSLLTNHSQAPWPSALFPNVGELYGRFAAARRNGTPKEQWGQAPLSVPAAHLPAMPPLRAAFEIRRMVFSRWRSDQFSPDGLTTVAQTCVLKFLIMLRAHIDPRIAVTLAMETLNAMAKTAPVLARHMEEFARNQARRA